MIIEVTIIANSFFFFDLVIAYNIPVLRLCRTNYKSPTPPRQIKILIFNPC
jgi:hypothetical protein